MNKKSMAKTKVFAVLIIFVLSFLFFMNGVASIQKDKFLLGEKVKINLKTYEDYKLKITTPSAVYIKDGSSDVFIFNPKEVGLYSFEVESDSGDYIYEFEVYEEIVQEIFEQDDVVCLSKEKVGNISEDEVFGGNEKEEIEYFKEKDSEKFVEIGKSVRWGEVVVVEVDKLKLNVPKNSENVSVLKNGEKVKYKESIISKINLFSDGVEIILEDVDGEVELEYYTKGPEKREKVIDANKKQVTIDSEFHYENVLAYTEVEEVLKLEQKDAIKIYWQEEEMFMDFKVFDENENGLIDRVEWIVPHLSEQNFEIIIEITRAEHLGVDKEFIDDIYEEVRVQDNVWTGAVSDGEYVRVVFEKNLTRNNDITIYPRTVSGSPRIEVYEKDREEVIAEFNNIFDYDFNKVFLSGLEGKQDSFDLKIVGGSVEFDYIVDPVSYNYTHYVLLLYPEAWWQLGEDGNDYSGNGHNVAGSVGNISFGVSIVPNGPHNYSLILNGSSGFSYPDSSLINTYTAPAGNYRAMSLWFNASSVASGNGNVIYEEGGGGNSISIYTYEDGGSYFIYCTAVEGANEDYVGTEINIGEVYHLGCIWDFGEGFIQMYINGNYSGEDSSLAIGSDLNSHGGNIAIGWPNQDSDNHLGQQINSGFHGQLADVVLWGIDDEGVVSDWVFLDIYNIGINGSFPSGFPFFSNQKDNSESLLDSGIAVFNVSVNNTNGTVFLNFDGVDYQAENLTGNIYNVSLDVYNFGNYNYYWKSFSNGSVSRANRTELKSYVVNQSTNWTYYAGFESGAHGWEFGGADAERSSVRSRVLNNGTLGGSWSAHLQDDTLLSYFNKSFNFLETEAVLVSFHYYPSSIDAGEYVQLFCDNTEIWRFTSGDHVQDSWNYAEVYLTQDDCVFNNSIELKFTGDPGLSGGGDDLWVDGINITPIVYDEVYPFFSNQKDNSESLLDSGIAVFNVSVNNTNGNVFLNFDGVDYQAENLTGNIYNVSLDVYNFGNYNYYWKSFSNGSVSRANRTELKSYVVNQSTNWTYYAGFESGIQGWKFGGADAERSSVRSRVLDNGTLGGSWSAHLEDDTLSSYFNKSFNFLETEAVIVSFHYYPYSIDTGEYVQLFCDNTEIWRFTSGDHVQDSWNYAEVYLTQDDCVFSANVDFRFTGNPGLSGGGDDLWMDGFSLISLTSPNISELKVQNKSGIDGGYILRGENVTINATVIDINDGVDSVWIDIWEGAIGSSVVLFNGLLGFVTGSLWSVEVETNDSFVFGDINYTVYANDTKGASSEFNSSFRVFTYILSQEAPFVVSSSVFNLTEDNLTCYNQTIYNGLDYPIKSIFNWYKNNQSLQILNMPFEGGSNATFARDYSSGSNNFTNVSDVFWNSAGGYDGRGAYEFDGNGDYLIDDNGEDYINSLSEITVMMWIKADNTGTDRGFFDTESSDGIDDVLGIRYDAAGFSSGCLNCMKASIATTGGQQFLESGDNTQSLDWTHVVLTWKSGENLTLYINGEDDVGAYKSASVSGVINGADKVIVGNGAKGSSFVSWDGSIDEVQIWNKSLSSQQIKAIYNNRTDLIVSQETLLNDNWSCEVVPNDGFKDGSINRSSNLEIILLRIISQGIPILNSSFGTNYTNENLTCNNVSTISSFNFSVKSIFNWYKNNHSLAVLNMPFEGGSNYSWTRDYSGYGNNGIVSGAIWNSTAGYDGFGAYEFSNDHISSLSNLGISGDDSRTMLFWSKANNTNNGVMVSIGVVGSNNLFAALIYNGNWFLNGYGGGQDWDTGISADTNLHHHVIVYNGTHSDWYLDGNKLGGGFDHVYNTIDNSLYIGDRPDGFGSYEGVVDDVFIFDFSLSEEQVLAFYNNRTNLIVSKETGHNENWICETTPNDGELDGASNKSNELLVFDSLSVNEGYHQNISGAKDGLVQVGDNFTINATVSDVEEGVQSVWVKIWEGAIGTSAILFNGFLSFITGDLWSVEIGVNSSFTKGILNYTIYANDSAGIDTQINRTVLLKNFSLFHSAPILNSSFGTNYTNENLTCNNVSISGENVRNIFNWYKNNQILQILNMPFEGGSNESWTRDYTKGSGGVVSGAIWNSTGGYNEKGAYEFDGDNDYISLGDYDEMDSPDYFTITMWFKRYTDMNSSTNHDIDNILLAQSSGSYNDNFEIGTDGSFIEIYFDAKISENNYLSYDVGISDNTWYFISFSYDINDTNESKLYFNGDFVSGWTVVDGGLDDSFDSPSSFGISRPESNQWGDFNGSIDEVQIWNISLSAEQIKAIYNNRTDLIVSQETNLNDIWKCDATINNGLIDGLSLESNNLQILDSLSIDEVLIQNSSGAIDGEIYLDRNFTINATVSDIEEGVENVWIKVWQGAIGTSSILFSGFMNFVSGDLWSVEIETNSSFSVGSINYTIYANDSIGVEVQRNSTFEIVPYPLFQGIPILSSSSGMNLTSDNLTCHNQSTVGINVRNIFNWYKNNQSLQVLNMPFEGGSNATFARDYSVGNNNFTNVIDVFWNITGGYDGRGAYEFDGNGDYLIDDNGEDYINSLSEITVMMWIKADNTGTDRGFFDTESSDGNDDVLGIRYDVSGSSSGCSNCMKASIATTGGQQFLESRDNTQSLDWTHVVLTWKSGENLTLYINGEDDVGAYKSASVSGVINGADKVIVGNGAKGSSSVSWDGSIDEVQIWNKSLSSQQIKAIYNNRTDLIVSQETSLNDNWSCAITINNGSVDGDKNKSAILRIEDALDILGTLAQNSSGIVGGIVSHGDSVTINATVSDVEDGVQNVWIKVWQGAIGTSAVLFSGLLNFVTGDLWSVEIETNSSFQSEIINYTIYANDSVGTEVQENGTINFEILDLKPPEFLDISPINGSFVVNPVELELETNESATCEYSISKNFIFGYGTEFSSTEDTSHSSVLENLSDGYYIYYFKCRDSFGNSNNDTNQGATSFYIDTTEPSVVLNSPDNGSVLFNPVLLNWTVFDNLDINLLCNITSNSVIVDSNISCVNGSSFARLLYLDGGDSIWNVTCWDSGGNSNTSKSRFVHVFSVDLVIGESSMVFNVSVPEENENVLIGVNVSNTGQSNAENVVVQFYDGDPNATGVQIGSDKIINISAGGNNITEIEWPARLGFAEIYVVVDPPIYSNGSILELNESNNKASKNLSVQTWEFFYGDVFSYSEYRLENNQSNKLLRWESGELSSGNIFVSDYESTVSWNDLLAIGRNIGGGVSNSDFSEIDELLLSYNFSDSVYGVYTDGVSVRNTTTINIFNDTIENVPIAVSINNSNFFTGILWDSSDDSDGEFDSTEKEDIVFVAGLNKSSIGTYGTYDYELRVPARLREYNNTDSIGVVFYMEIF